MCREVKVLSQNIFFHIPRIRLLMCLYNIRVLDVWNRRKSLTGSPVAHCCQFLESLWICHSPDNLHSLPLWPFLTVIEMQYISISERRWLPVIISYFRQCELTAVWIKQVLNFLNFTIILSFLNLKKKIGNWLRIHFYTNKIFNLIVKDCEHMGQYQVLRCDCLWVKLTAWMLHGNVMSLWLAAENKTQSYVTRSSNYLLLYLHCHKAGTEVFTH